MGTEPTAIGRQGIASNDVDLERELVASKEERAALQRMGDTIAVRDLRMPRNTLARIAAGFRVRAGTLALFRLRLASAAEEKALRAFSMKG